MNITAAIVTGATVTVYFVGLVHFQDVTSSSVKVTVPLATAATVTHGTLTLDPHFAEVIVVGADTAGAAATVCPNNTSTGDTATGRTCTYQNLEARTEITLPDSTSTAFTTSGFEDLPHLVATCTTDTAATIGPIKPDYAYTGNQVALRATLEKGTLAASKEGDAWKTKLTIENASNTFEIGKNKVTLLSNADAQIWIKNQPATSTGTVVDEQHFWWYYHMYSNAGACRRLPARAVEPSDAHPTGHRHKDYATSVGCSNTQYP